MIHDIPDGTAVAAIEALEMELEAVRIIAKELECSSTGLHLENVSSTTSDGAASQSKMNRLLQQGKSSGNIVENKCAMHLGVNLRVAQVSGIQVGKLMNESIVL